MEEPGILMILDNISDLFLNLPLGWGVHFPR